MSNLPLQFLDLLKRRGFTLYAGVPCSLLKGLIYYAERDREIGYLSAVREDAAIGMASGAYLAGGKGVVFMQNSGFGLSINALTSLNQIYDIPVLLVISWRGYQGKDAPEHLIMGAKMLDLLALLQIESRILVAEQMDRQLAELDEWMTVNRKPAALIVHKGLMDKVP
ncbi:MAG: hypothetical protein JW797_12745 [Bradymonadales bacterium]|nr:hypothetical protein [Bradymonadales bacterium]